MVYSIWLSTLPKVGPVSRQNLLKTYGSAENVWTALHGLPEYKDHALDSARKTLDLCSQKGIFIVKAEQLINCSFHDLPLILYCKGTLKKQDSSIGIVGCRRCTEYGKKMTAESAGSLAAAGVTVVSGMACGIDAVAHTAALKNGGYTIAVLGTGPDICFPASHRNLMHAIEESGLIVSEYPPGFHGSKGSFPCRNRIIAALSDRILVTEAGIESGALITAKYALSYQKPVFAIPGRLDSKESEGCNLLIQQEKAKMWTLDMNRPNWTQEEMNLDENTFSTRSESHEADRNALGKMILKQLKRNERTSLSLLIDRLASDKNIKKEDVINEITELELDMKLLSEGEFLWLP